VKESIGSNDRLTWGADSRDRSNNTSFATCECTHLSDFSIIDNPVAVFSGLKDRYSDAWKEERAKRDHWVIVSATAHRLSGNTPLLTHSEQSAVYVWVLQGLLCALWFLFALAYAHLYIKDPGEMWEYVYRVPETR
jgi:hypothetical protein